MAILDRQKEHTQRFHNKKRALHTDDWYEQIGNHQILTCSRCKLVGPARENFYKQRPLSTGFSCYCKKCQLKRNADAAFRKTYGLDSDQRMELLRSGDGKCGICSRTLVKFHVDHCHSTGKVRGVLCSTCNQAIGLFKDSEDLMLKAIEYLREGRS